MKNTKKPSNVKQSLANVKDSINREFGKEIGNIDVEKFSLVEANNKKEEKVLYLLI
jgi:hypothetical protein